MLDSKVIELAQGKNFAAFTTIFPSGYPQTSIMWIDADEEYILINTEVHRAKYKNVTSNPKVTVVIWEADNPYGYHEVRGDVVEVITGPTARAHIDRLARKYTGEDYTSTIESERVLLKIRPNRVRFHG